MAKKTLFMETTEVSPEKTAGEILGALVAAGASQVALQYENKKLSGLRFGLDIPKRGTVIYALPARVQPIFKLLNGRRQSWDREDHADKDLAQAERVAWRQLYRWILAQVALIETGMVEPGEVFLPYQQGEDGRTLWEHVLAGETQLALPPATDQETNVKRFPGA